MDKTIYYVNRYSRVNTFPHVVAKLTLLINDPYSSMREFEKIIEMDPVLVSRVLQLVNSSAFSLMHKVNSIGRAVAFLGMQNLHNLAVTDTLHAFFNPKQVPEGEFSAAKLWQHSVAVAITSKTIAEKVFGIEGERAYLAGILHDFGIIVEHQIAEEKFTQLCKNCSGSTILVAREKALLHTDHTKIGELLSVNWNMPKEISLTIKKHHRCSGVVEPSSLHGILQISEYICDYLDQSAFPNYKINISPNLLEHIEENAGEYEVIMDELPELFTAIQELYP